MKRLRIVNPPYDARTSGWADATGPSLRARAIGTALGLGKSFRQRVTARNDAGFVFLPACPSLRRNASAPEKLAALKPETSKYTRLGFFDTQPNSGAALMIPTKPNLIVPARVGPPLENRGPGERKNGAATRAPLDTFCASNIHPHQLFCEFR